MFVMEVQEKLENLTTGGVSSFSRVRAMLQFVATSYFMLRSLSREDIEYLGKNDTGLMLLAFGGWLDETLGYEQPLHRWTGIAPLGPRREIGEIDVPAEILDKIRAQAREEVLEDLTWDDLTPALRDELTEGLEGQIKEQILENAADAAEEALGEQIRWMDTFDPDDVNRSINDASKAMGRAQEKIRTIRDSVKDYFDELSESLDEIAGPLATAYDEMPTDGIDWGDIANDFGHEIRKSIETL